MGLVCGAGDVISLIGGAEVMTGMGAVGMAGVAFLSIFMPMKIRHPSKPRFTIKEIFNAIFMPMFQKSNGKSVQGWLQVFKR
jgi:hypothetical protein